MARRFPLLLALLLMIVLVATGGHAGRLPDVPAAEPEDFSGGYTIPWTGLWVGGEATLEIHVPRFGRADAVLEPDLLLRWEPTPTLAFLTETELEEPVRWVEGEGIEGGSRILDIERLYLDWNPTSTITARGGKFLTPFGLWNQIRRAPLAWTVDRPVVTERFFPEHATGLELVHQTSLRGWIFDAMSYGPAQDKLALNDEDDESGAIVGGRMALGHALGRAWIGLGSSVAAIADEFRGPWHGVGGLDVDVGAFGHLVTSEVYYGPPRRGRHRMPEWGFYLQDAIPLVEGLHGVLRLEHYDGPGRPLEAGVFGVAWRPWKHLIVKVDGQVGSRDFPTADFHRGFSAALTLFF